LFDCNNLEQKIVIVARTVTSTTRISGKNQKVKNIFQILNNKNNNKKNRKWTSFREINTSLPSSIPKSLSDNTDNNNNNNNNSTSNNSTSSAVNDQHSHNSIELAGNGAFMFAKYANLDDPEQIQVSTCYLLFVYLI
jgi:hypothetical protein